MLVTLRQLFQVKVTVKDPSHLTDDEKNQVKNNVDNANKDSIQKTFFGKAILNG